MVGEFTATPFGSPRPYEVAINRQPSPPERVVIRDQGEELVSATKRKHILGFTE